MIEITVENRIPQVQDAPEIVCGNSDYTVVFDFDSEWDEFPDKTAHFRYIRNGLPEIVSVDFVGTVCAVPALHDTDYVEIGVSAGSIRTSAPARVRCCRCITDIPAELHHVQSDAYLDLLEMLESVVPVLETDEVYIITAEGDYVSAANGDFIIARE